MRLLDLLKNKAAKNASWLIGERIIQMLISLIVGLLTARYLGPSNFGLISYATSFTAFFAVFCNLGINSLLVKELVDRPEQEGEVLGTALILRAVSSILSAIAIFAMVFVLDNGERTTLIVVTICSIGMILQVFEVFRYWFQRHLLAKYSAMAALIAYVATAAYRIILIIQGADVIWFALATSVDYIILAVCFFAFYKTLNGQRLGFSWEYGKALLSRSKHFILSGLMVSIYAQTDKMMLKQILDVEQTGFYTTATTINNMWCFILVALIDSMTPSIMEAHNYGHETTFQKKNRQLYAIVIYVSFVAALLFNIFAELIVWILYGTAYLPAAMPLRVISWYTAFSYLGTARNAWIVSKNKQKYLTFLYAAAAVANVLLNFLLIPLWGASGAALASLAAQILTGFLLPFFIRDLRPNAKLMLEAIVLKDVFPRKSSKN